ncbi:unnamed protein product [Echinostoma caproni]|uniref:C-type lectin domain-containing protein n=1 Tax=Echinostoma caproni TaxID=27848 RepID=A0A183A563_9TREM|nr:unnamed protein product [Echinostoma caproni]
MEPIKKSDIKTGLKGQTNALTLISLTILTAGNMHLLSVLVQTQTISILIYLSNVIFRQCETVCPVDFLDAGEGVCLLRVAREVTYYEAHQICEQEGQKRGLRLFIPGRNAPKMLPYSSSLLVFTGYNALLNRSVNLRAGWRVTDPGFASFVTTASDTTIRWSGNEPNGQREAISVYYYGWHVDDIPEIYHATDVICEISSFSAQGVVERFEKNWPYQLNSLFLQDSSIAGSFQMYVVSTTFSCLVRYVNR